jgi:hypothetical protein
MKFQRHVCTRENSTQQYAAGARFNPFFWIFGKPTTEEEKGI